MNSDIDTSLDRRINALPRVAGALAIAVGSIVILGWLFGIESLKSLHPSMVSMKANTALAFVIAGVSLLLYAAPGAGRLKMIARFMASVLVLIGLVNIAQYAFTWDAGIDQFLFPEPERTVGTYLPGRMVLNTAINFSFFGLALLMLGTRTRWTDGLAHVAALLVGLFGILAVIAYAFGVPGSTGLGVYTRMALHTAFAFIFLSVGLVCLRPDIGVMAVVRDRGSAGYMARRLMPAALLLPVVLGWFVARGEMMGLYGPQFGDVIDAAAYVAIFVVLVWIISRSLINLDAERKKLEESFLRSEKEFKELFDDAPVGYHEIDAEGRYARINHTELRSLGFQAEEMLGHFCWEFVREREESQRATLAKLSGTRPPAKGVERLFIRKDGTMINVIIEDQLLRDGLGHITGIRTTVQDISELKRVQELVRESDEKNRALLQNLAEGVGVADGNEQFSFANSAAESIFGVPASGLVGRSLQEFVDPDEFERIRKQTVKRQKRETTSYEIQIIRPDGAKRDLLVTASPFIDKGGLVTGAIGVFHDLTDRKLMDESLRKAEAHYRLIVEGASDLIYNLDPQGYVTSVNPATSRLLGYSPDEILGKRYVAFVRPDFRKRTERTFLVQSRRKTPSVYFEAPILTKDGRELWVGQNVDLIVENDEAVGYQAVSRDITERKRAEESLKQSVSLLQATLESTADGILVVDSYGKITSYNMEFAKMWTIPDEIVASRDDRRALDHVLEQLKDPEAFISKVKHLYAHPEESSFDVLEFKDGRTFERYSQPQRIDEKPTGRVWSFRDITARRRAEQEIRLLAQTISSARDCVSVADLEDKIVFVNVAFLQTYGYGREELLGQPISILRSEQTSAELEGEILIGTLAGEWHGEILNRRKDGSEFPIELWTSIVKDESGKGIATVGVARDISVRKTAERERESLIIDLKKALEQVKTLGGLVPICASCKKIRDDKGYWNQLEKYLGDHTDAKLTHGLCPDCAKLYFPEAAVKAGL